MVLLLLLLLVITLIFIYLIRTLKCGREAQISPPSLPVAENDSTAEEVNQAIPCYDQLREELTCDICWEICFEPATTSCGHSFCKSCLCQAAGRMGNLCPRCRQKISNCRSYTVNIVLWNTIQLIFPEEVKARKVAAALTISLGIRFHDVINQIFQDLQAIFCPAYENHKVVARGPRRNSGIRNLSSRGT